MRAQPLLRSPFSRLFVFVLYARSEEFQICSRCSWDAKILLSIEEPVIDNRNNHPDFAIGYAT